MSNIISHHWTSDIEKLEAFVRNKLDKKEMSLLSAHLENCEECRKKVEEEKNVRAGIQGFGRMELKRRLKSRLQRERGRRLEWTHVASLAAAIVIVLGAVFTIRYFVDFKQQKLKVQEIVINGNKENTADESKPEERSLWIIGIAADLSEGSTAASKKNRNLAYSEDLKEVQEQPVEHQMETQAKARDRFDQHTVKYDDKKITGGEAEPAPAAPKNTSLNDSDKNLIEKNKDLAVNEPAEPKVLYNAQNQRTGKLVSRSPAAGDSTPIKGELSKSPSDLNINSRGSIPEKGDSAQLSERNPELQKGVPPVSGIAPKLTAKLEMKERYSSRQELPMSKKKRSPAKNIIVRRGNMKDLPASMRTSDPNAVQTKLERTQQGVLLTFYSNAIKDTAATFIEAVTKDSVIVSFKNKQIAYHIPGGLSGGM